MSRAFVLLWALLALPAWAHVVVADGTIGATLHVDPDDAPVTGAPSRFELWFKDTTGRLQPGLCQGTFAVSLNGELVASGPLFEPGASSLLSVHQVTFTRPGVYAVSLSGTPVGGEFQPFRLQFHIRVRAGEGASALAATGDWFADHAPQMVVATVLAALLVGWVLRPRRRR